MASTRDMIFSIYQLIAFISSVMTLEAGDLVLTGTPAGIGPLLDGDVVKVAVEGIGELLNPVEKAKENPAYITGLSITASLVAIMNFRPQRLSVIINDTGLEDQSTWVGIDLIEKLFLGDGCCHLAARN